nr:hypothetical protein [Nitrososphaeria archaeon]
LVKLVNDSQINRYLRLELAPEMEAVIAPSRRALQLQGGEPFYIKQTGEDAGTEVAGDELKGKSRYLVELGQITPYKYQGIIHINPDLNKLGVVGPVMAIAEPGEPTVISYTFQPFKNCDLTKLDWHVRIYLLD